MVWTIVITAAISVLAVVLAMNFATPEKKLERKIEHRYAVADPQFRREMGGDAGPVDHCRQPRDRAAERRRDLSRDARGDPRGASGTITFETYIYWSGEIGEEFTEALSERARAGVPVNVTVDWAGSIKMDEELRRTHAATRACACTTTVRCTGTTWAASTTGPIASCWWWTATIGFTGGVGIADQWLGHAEDPDHWRESHFRIEGPAVAQMQAAFNDNWIKTTGEVLNGAAVFPAAGDGRRRWTRICSSRRPRAAARACT